MPMSPTGEDRRLSSGAQVQLSFHAGEAAHWAAHTHTTPAASSASLVSTGDKDVLVNNLSQ